MKSGAFSSAGGVEGELRAAGAGVAAGSTCAAGSTGEGGATGAGSLGGGTEAGGGSAGGGWAFRAPGGAASGTGAPHCSQYSPARSSGPLQKRQSTAPGWTTGPSKDSSSSISTILSRKRGRACPVSAPGGGVIMGVGAVFSEIVGDGLRACGRTVTGTGGAGAIGGSGGSSGSAGSGKSASMGGVGAREAPH